MAGDRLMLSALKTGVACSLNNNVSRNKCLIHVKLTDFCNKTVENLIESEKVHTTSSSCCCVQTGVCVSISGSSVFPTV